MCARCLKGYNNATFVPTVMDIFKYCHFNFKFILHSSGEEHQCKIVLYWHFKS